MSLKAFRVRVTGNLNRFDCSSVSTSLRFLFCNSGLFYTLLYFGDERCTKFHNKYIRVNFVLMSLILNVEFRVNVKNSINRIFTALTRTPVFYQTAHTYKGFHLFYDT